MSHRHVAWVYSDPRFAGLESSAMAVLVALAHCASDRGRCCWPSETWLMRATHLSRATIYRHKPKLREWIEIDPPGYKRSNCYWFPPIDKKGVRVSEVAKVIQAKKEQEMEEKGEIAGTLDGEPIAVDKPDGVINKSLTMRQNQDSECRITDFSGLTVRRLPSHGETGDRLMVRPEIRIGTEKEMGGLIPSHGETSHGETVVDNYDGSRPPTKKEHYDWIERQCRAAGMDKTHVEQFLAKHRPWGWNAMRPGVNVCDLIADFVTTWKEKSFSDWKTTQEYIKNGVL